MTTSEGVTHPESNIEPTVARSFVSRFVARRLEGGEPLVGAERHELHAALLLTDIEGFTSRVEGLGAEGAAGLERLAAEVNAYFVCVAEAIRAFGGDVLGIAGDSFLAMWPAASAAEADLAAVVQSAASAATVMQERIAALAGAAPAMATRAGIAAGPLTLTFAGGFEGRWELVPSGPALAAVARAERHGRAGVVTLTDEAALQLTGATLLPGAQGLMELTEFEPAPLPPVPVEPVPEPGRVEPYVPLPVRHGAAVASPWLAEFRPVTSVMVSLRDDGSDTERVHEAVRRFQELMVRFGGASKVQVDNKGLTCAGLFGLPPSAHDDDVLRGLRTAQAAFAGLADLFAFRTVGVASGKVLCGMFGSDVRREYSVFGDAINIAARLSALGEGAILVDDSTAHGSPLQLSGTPRPDLRVRGRRRPAEVMELTGIEAFAEGRSIVNRDSERALILARMGDVLESGRSAVVLLTGEPGIGKSTVARQALSFAADAGMRTLDIAADAVDRTTPYGPWRPLVGELLAPGGGPLTGDELLARVGRQDTDARLLPLLGTVLAGAPAENAMTEAMTGDVRRDQTNELITRAVATATEQRPLALLVDDAQWLDSASWSLLLRVSAAVPRLLLLVTQRRTQPGDPGASEREELLAIAGAAEIEIRSLDAAETTTLIQHRLGVTSIPRPVLELILDRVAGHPLFCESLVSAMVSSGTIRIGGDSAELMGGSDGVPRVDIPATIESAVLSRVDRLSSGHEMTLKAASVVGRMFTVPEVVATHPSAGSAEIAAHLDELCRLELIDRVGREGDAVFAFRHQIVRDVAYQLLTGAQRTPLHRALVEHLEAADVPETAAMLAHHWLAAGEPPRALPHLEQGGREALRDGAFAEAVRLFEAAIEHLGEHDPVRRALLEKSLADAHYFLGNMVGGRALLELSLERLGHPVAQTPAGGVRDLAREIGAQGRRLLSRTPEPVPSGRDEVLATVVEAHRVLVQISYLHGGSAIELSAVTVAALNLAERLGPSPELARALAHAAALASVFGLRPLADRYGQRAIEMAGQDANAAASAYVWNILAIMRAQRGEWGMAIDANERALELFGELGDYNFEAELWQTRSALELCRGTVHGASVAARRTQELAERTGSEVNLCWSLLDQAQLLLARGETAPAAGTLDRALAIPTPGADGGTVIERWATTAWTRLQQGRLAEAVAEADTVIALAGRQLATGWIWAEMTALAVEVLLAVRERPSSGVSPGTLDRKIARGLRVLARLTPTFAGVRSRTHVLRARAALRQGNAPAAHRALRRAERAIVSTAGPLDEARIAIVRAEMAATAPARRALLEPVLADLGRLGQGAELGRAEALL